MSLSLNSPSGLQDPEGQIAAIEKAFRDIQDAFNSQSTQPSVVVHVPSATLSTVKSTTSATYIPVPGYSWTIKSLGGLVDLAAVFAGVCQDSDAGTIGLFIDGKILLEGSTHALNGGSGSNAIFNIKMAWRAILGQGQHVIAFKYKTIGGIALSINSTNRGPASSSISIIEFPANVQSFNVSAN